MQQALLNYLVWDALFDQVTQLLPQCFLIFQQLRLANSSLLLWFESDANIEVSGLVAIVARVGSIQSVPSHEGSLRHIKQNVRQNGQ